MNYHLGQTGYRSDSISGSEISDNNEKISKSQKHLEDILRAKAHQKKMQKIASKYEPVVTESSNLTQETIDSEKYRKHPSKPSKVRELPAYLYDMPPTGPNIKAATKQQHFLSTNYQYPVASSVPSNKQAIGYTNIWDAYWPFIGSAGTGSKLDIELDYLTFNGMLVEKWSTSLPTPPINTFPIKDLLKINILSGKTDFDFDIRLENLPSSGAPVVINISPKSTILPFNLNQFMLIKDSGIVINSPGVNNTNVLGIVGYYNSSQSYLNNFTQNVDSFENVKNVFLSTQLFFVHVNQIKDDVKLNITHNTGLGENLFKVYIETDSKVEIKEVQIPVIITNPDNSIQHADITIEVKTIYINSKYFMTYAYYSNDVTSAQQLINTDGYMSDLRQTPIQLASMLLFGPNVPIVNLDSTNCNTDHERMLVKLFRDVLMKNP